MRLTEGKTGDGEGNGYRGKTGSLGTQTEGFRGVDSGREGVQSLGSTTSRRWAARSL